MCRPLVGVRGTHAPKLRSLMLGTRKLRSRPARREAPRRRMSVRCRAGSTWLSKEELRGGPLVSEQTPQALTSGTAHSRPFSRGFCVRVCLCACALRTDDHVDASRLPSGRHEVARHTTEARCRRHPTGHIFGVGPLHGFIPKALSASTSHPAARRPDRAVEAPSGRAPPYTCCIY